MKNIYNLCFIVNKSDKNRLYSTLQLNRMFWNNVLKKHANNLNIHYKKAWGLIPNGDIFYTYACLVQPVIYEGKNAILKISMEEEEKYGGILMQWWDGAGAAKVYRYTEEALLLEAITGVLSLKQMAENNMDDPATNIICDVAEALHKPRNKPLPALIDLEDWFSELFDAHKKYGNRFSSSAAIARELLDTTIVKNVLHGDLHHENILYSNERGWLAIDPKRLYGDSGFDYANLFCNPSAEVALHPLRLQQQLHIVCTRTGISQRRMLQWITAYSVLSGIWSLSANEDASIALAINKIALQELAL